MHKLLPLVNWLISSLSYLLGMLNVSCDYEKELMNASFNRFLLCGILCIINPIQKQLIAVKKSARPSKAELTATKSNDIIMRPCARCASCKINIS